MQFHRPVICDLPPARPSIIVYRTSGKSGMRPKTRHTLINMVMFAVAFAIVMAITFMRPAARVAKHGPAGETAVATQEAGNR
jgi:hypothetical protein